MGIDARYPAWAGDKRMYDYERLRRDAHERRVMSDTNRRLDELERILTGIYAYIQADDAKEEIVAKTTKSGKKGKVTGTPDAPLYVPVKKPTCQEPTCDRYGKKGFTENGAKFHTLRTKHKIS